MKKVIIIGIGDHVKVCAEIILIASGEIYVFLMVCIFRPVCAVACTVI